jgi:AbrB family looped-hinge helix DNA binding protein
MTSTLTVTAEGQVTLKKEVLDHLGVEPGDKVEVDLVAPGRVEIRTARPAGGLNGFIGCLHDPDGPVLSLEEIEEATHAGWAGQIGPFAGEGRRGKAPLLNPANGGREP